MQTLTKDEAKQQNAFLKITSNDTPKSIFNFIQNYNQETLFIETISGKQFLIDMRAKELNMLTLYKYQSNTEPEQLKEFTTITDTINICLNPVAQVKEISNSTSSIFLDEYNLAYHLLNAQNLQKQYGPNKINDMNITGDEYLKRIQTIIQVAHDIMDGKLMSTDTFFDSIPVKKDKTFQANKTIPIFTNGLIDAAAYDGYVEKNELMLCLVPHGTWTYAAHYDLSQETTKNRARLCIKYKQGAKKIVPLINKDLSINDILTKTKYLSNDMIKAGGIYKEKSGTEYLYLGKIIIGTHYDIIWRPQSSLYHTYIRITKKIQTLIDNSNSLDEFFKQYVDLKIKRTDDDLNLSQRFNPRKFTEETSAPFIHSPFSITNSVKNICNSDNYTYKCLFTKTEIDYPYNDKNKTIDVPYIILTE